MPHGLDSGDRKLLIGAGVLLVILVVVSTFLTPREMSSGRAFFPSSYSAKWDGAKGAYLLLAELGYDVRRWEESPTSLDNDAHDVLILAQPLQVPTAEEKAALQEFVRQGG